MKKCLMLLALISTNNFYASDKKPTLRETRAIKLAQINQRRAKNTLRTTNFDEAFNAAYAQLMAARTIRDIKLTDLGIEETVDTQLKYVQQSVNGKQNQKKRHHYQPTTIVTRD